MRASAPKGTGNLTKKLSSRNQAKIGKKSFNKIIDKVNITLIPLYILQ